MMSNPTPEERAAWATPGFALQLSSATDGVAAALAIIARLLAALTAVEEEREALRVMGERYATALDEAIRHGAREDQPEGSRVITMSDTLARQWSARLRGEPAAP